MKDTIIVFKKELKGILRDKRLLITITLIPLLFIPTLFYFVGQTSSSVKYEKITIAYKESSGFINLLKKNDVELLHIDDVNIAMKFDAWNVFVQEDDKENEITVYINTKLDNFNVIKRRIDYYYSEYKNETIERNLKALKILPSKIYPKKIVIKDVTERKNRYSIVLSFLLPYLILIYLFSNAMGVGLDSIAGEKERGTLQLLLVNRIKRNSILFGKLFATMSVSLTGTVFSLIGIFIAVKMNFMNFESNINFIMKPDDFFFLSLLIISLSMFIVSILIFISTYSRTIKEGQGYVMPIYLLIIILGISSLTPGSSIAIQYAHWPFISSVTGMVKLLVGEYSLQDIFTAMVSNIVLASILIRLSAYFFNKESIIFRK
jgi:sodium transport system permease protein